MSWSAGQGVALAYEGSAPDIGAFEFGDSTPDPPVDHCPPAAPPVSCNEGIDNDGDGRVDFDRGVSAGLPPGEITAPEAQCVGKPWKNRERLDGGRCGLGFELTLLLPRLMRLYAEKRARANA